MFYFPNCFGDNTSVCFALRLLIKQTKFAYKYRRQYDDVRHLNAKYCLKFIRSQCSWHYSVGYEFSVDFSNLMRQSLIRSLTILPPKAIGVKHFYTQFLPLIKILSIIFSFLKHCLCLYFYRVLICILSHIFPSNFTIFYFTSNFLHSAPLPPFHQLLRCDFARIHHPRFSYHLPHPARSLHFPSFCSFLDSLFIMFRSSFAVPRYHCAAVTPTFYQF